MLLGALFAGTTTYLSWRSANSAANCIPKDQVPVGKQCENNDVMTLMRRDDVASISVRRHFDFFLVEYMVCANNKNSVQTA